MRLDAITFGPAGNLVRDKGLIAAVGCCGNSEQQLKARGRSSRSPLAQLSPSRLRYCPNWTFSQMVSAAATDPSFFQSKQNYFGIYKVKLLSPPKSREDTTTVNMILIQSAGHLNGKSLSYCWACCPLRSTARGRHYYCGHHPVHLVLPPYQIAISHQISNYIHPYQCFSHDFSSYFLTGNNHNKIFPRYTQFFFVLLLASMNIIQYH